MSSALQDVCDFCNQHLEANQQAFADPKLHFIYDDAKAQLQQAQGTFDVIIADLADPVYGGPCYQVPSQMQLRQHLHCAFWPEFLVHCATLLAKLYGSCH